MILNLLHKVFFFISNFKQIFHCRNVGKSLLSDRNGLSGSQVLGSCPPSFSSPALSGVSLVVLNEEANLISAEAPHKCASS